MTAWPEPANVRELRGLQGLLQEVSGYGAISRPLTELLKKGVEKKPEKHFSSSKVLWYGDAFERCLGERLERVGTD